jgi:hypothetical protein
MAFESAFPAIDSATISSLRGTPNTTINTESITNPIHATETAGLLQGINSADGSSNSALTYGSYLSRNMTIRDVASSLTKQNQEAARGGARDTFARQSEINEWQAQNKLDTLFFMQILFLYFTLLVITLYLRQTGILPNIGVYMIAGLGLLIVVGVLWNRASYTQISRDKRYWNRRYIGLEDAGNLGAKLQCSIEAS